jgi:hypothetical protein
MNDENIVPLPAKQTLLALLQGGPSEELSTTLTQLELIPLENITLEETRDFTAKTVAEVLAETPVTEALTTTWRRLYERFPHMTKGQVLAAIQPALVKFREGR